MSKEKEKQPWLIRPPFFHFRITYVDHSNGEQKIYVTTGKDTREAALSKAHLSEDEVNIKSIEQMTIEQIKEEELKRETEQLTRRWKK